jgi:transcriptional regulator with XRE-family HTH domain
MSTINVPAFTRKLREVVADEPKAFAYDLGLSLSAVYNYLNGRVPATEVLFRIAQYTGRPMEWFLVDDEVGGTTAVSVSVAPEVPAGYAAAPGGGDGT